MTWHEYNGENTKGMKRQATERPTIPLLQMYFLINHMMIQHQFTSKTKMEEITKGTKV